MIQELWSGYGQIVRLGLEGGAYQTVVAKYVALPSQANHPRGWNTNLSHLRKVRSYQVESFFYQHQNQNCDDFCRTPELLAHLQEGEQTLLLFEDLDASGYPSRLTSVAPRQVELCLQWLAEFHASFLTEKAQASTLAEGLWQTGTYWHLATRPDELAALDDEVLKAAAPAIDEALSNARYQTLVHGDAKLANFCFSQNGCLLYTSDAADE